MREICIGDIIDDNLVCHICGAQLNQETRGIDDLFEHCDSHGITDDYVVEQSRCAGGFWHFISRVRVIR